LNVYNLGWNENEWFTVAVIAAGYAAVFWLPKRFTLQQKIIFSTMGIFFSVIVDHTISIPPFDYYDVNDTNKFEFMDFMVYLMYGPFGYIYLYLYDWLGRPYPFIPLYILGWTLFAILLEEIAVSLEVFHYKSGYHLDYSPGVYISLMSLLFILFYRYFPVRSGSGERG
jgi:hypothetical protein